MKKPNYHSEIIKILNELHKLYPNQNMGRHLYGALIEYGDFWGISDKEFLFALSKYKTQLEMDGCHTNPSEIEDIVKDALDLNNILKEEDNGEDY